MRSCENPASYWSVLHAFACWPQQDIRDSEKLFHYHYCYLFWEECNASIDSSCSCVTFSRAEPLRYWLCRPRKQIANLCAVVLVGKPAVGSAELPAVWKVFFFSFFSSTSLWRTHRYCVSASFNLASALMRLHWFLLYRPGYLVTRLQWAVTHNPLLWLVIDKLDRPQMNCFLGEKKRKESREKSM